MKIAKITTVVCAFMLLMFFTGTPVNAVNFYDVNITVDSGITAPKQLNYNLPEGNSETLDFTSKEGYLISSITINGVEQIGTVTTSHEVSINDIRENVFIKITSKSKNILPIEGNSQIYEKGSGKNIIIKFDYDFASLQPVSVTIDNKVVTQGYELSQGSVILTINNTTLENLSVGEHNIEIALETGEVMVGEFEVIEAEEDVIKSPKTGDSGMIHYIMALISLLGIGSILTLKMKLK